MQSLPVRQIRSLAAGTAILGLLLGSCQQTDSTANTSADSAPIAAAEDAEISQESTMTATVTAITPETRLITIMGEAGNSVVVVAGPEVRNFDQIEVGDAVKVRYRESLAVSVRQPGEASEPRSSTLAAGAAPEGAKPGAAIGQQSTVTVRMESIDLERSLVVFTPPEGGLRAVHVVTPEGKEFIKGLKQGDQVEITYTEAFAISIEEQ